MERILDDMYNHGQDGLKSIVLKNIAKQDAVREERLIQERKKAEEDAARFKEQEARDRKHANRIAFFAAVISVLIAIIGFLELNRQWHEGMLNIPPVFHSRNVTQVLSLMQHEESAGAEFTRR